MTHSKRDRWQKLGLGAIATLLLVSCRVQDDLTLALRPDYLGPACLELGRFRGRLDVQVANGTLQQRFRIPVRDQAEHHALELGQVSAARPLEIAIQGNLAAGQLDALIHYGRCEQYANANWQLHRGAATSADRAELFRFLAAVIGGVSVLVLLTQFQHLQTLLAATDYDLAQLMTALKRSPQPLYVKVQGQVKADKPLRSPWKRVACVYFSKRVTQQYKQMGKKGTVTKTLESRSQRIPFQLCSGSTQVEVNPDGAAISACTTYRETQPGSPGIITTQESVLPCDRTVLIMGMAIIQQGQVRLQQPRLPLKPTRFQIYREDAQTLEQGVRRAMRWSFVIAVICALFWLPLVVPNMTDPAQVLQDWTQDW